MNWTWLISVCAFTVSMSGTPGPNNTMLVASGAHYGFSRTLPHLLGIALGVPTMLLAVGLFGQPFLQNAEIRMALKWVGVVYMLWLASKIALANTQDVRSENSASRKDDHPISFFQAAVFQWINPKAWIVSAGALVTYSSDAHGQNSFTLTLVFAVIFGALSFPCVALWTMIGVHSSRHLKSRRSRQLFNYGMAALLLLSLIPVIFE